MEGLSCNSLFFFFFVFVCFGAPSSNQLEDVIGLDVANKGYDRFAARPLFFAAATGSRHSTEALISGYKKMDLDTASEACVWEVKAHPDKAGKWNLMSEAKVCDAERAEAEAEAEAETKWAKRCDGQ